MCEVKTVLPVNIEEQRVLLDLNLTEAAYLIVCMSRYSSGLLTGNEQNVYARLNNAVEGLTGGSREISRVDQRRGKYYEDSIRRKTTVAA